MRGAFVLITLKYILIRIEELTTGVAKLNVFVAKTEKFRVNKEINIFSVLSACRVLRGGELFRR